MKTSDSEKYWNDHWHKEKFLIAPQHHPIRQWIESEIPQTTDGSVFEIGCYPGKFLAVFGEKGYTLNGVDLFPENDLILQTWLKNENYKIGQFYQSDFWTFLPTQQYDIVCSFGFIEHFKNYDEALIKHINLVKDGGYVLTDVPNLKSPIYYLLYKILEPVVLRNHELSAMNKDAIRAVFENNGCSVKTAAYTGYFYFRFVTRHDKFSLTIAKFINFLRPLFELFPKSMYMRYIVVSAIKHKS